MENREENVGMDGVMNQNTLYTSPSVNLTMHSVTNLQIFLDT